MDHVIEIDTPVPGTPARAWVFHPTPQQTGALRACWLHAQRCETPEDQVVARVLLGLHDGQRFALDLTLLRVLHEETLRHVFDLLVMQRWPSCAVAPLLDRLLGRTDMADRLEHLACLMRLPGARRPAELPKLRDGWTVDPGMAPAGDRP